MHGNGLNEGGNVTPSSLPCQSNEIQGGRGGRATLETHGEIEGPKTRVRVPGVQLPVAEVAREVSGLRGVEPVRGGAAGGPGRGRALVARRPFQGHADEAAPLRRHREPGRLAPAIGHRRVRPGARRRHRAGVGRLSAASRGSASRRCYCRWPRCSAGGRGACCTSPARSRERRSSCARERLGVDARRLYLLAETPRARSSARSRARARRGHRRLGPDHLLAEARRPRPAGSRRCATRRRSC